MKTLNLTIEGMSCGHCVMAVKKEFAKVEGLRVDSVEIGKASVTIDDSKVTEDTIIHAVDEAGYKVAGIVS